MSFLFSKIPRIIRIVKSFLDTNSWSKENIDLSSRARYHLEGSHKFSNTHTKANFSYQSVEKKRQEFTYVKKVLKDVQKSNE